MGPIDLGVVRGPIDKLSNYGSYSDCEEYSMAVRPLIELVMSQRDVVFWFTLLNR